MPVWPDPGEMLVSGLLARARSKESPEKDCLGSNAAVQETETVLLRQSKAAGYPGLTVQVGGKAGGNCKV